MVLRIRDRCEITSKSGDLADHPFFIDFEDASRRFRLEKAGIKSEAVARAVIGNLKTPVVYDATAGLGRDAAILSSLGARVFMFERNPAVWLLLEDALKRVRGSLTNPPVLMPLGSALSYLESSENREPSVQVPSDQTPVDQYSFSSVPAPSVSATPVSADQVPADHEPAVQVPAPDVIYYDPMFPKKRKSALVKKGMQVFHALVGLDEDIEETLKSLRRHAKKRVVLKRPVTSPPVGKPAYIIEGKQCRFEAYLPEL